MEYIYLIAWGATVIIAVYALNKWNDFEAWYHDLDKWWDANYTYIHDSCNRFAILYDRAFKAAQDLDKQVTDYRYVIAENNIKIAMLEKQVSDCHEIIDDLDAEVAMLHTNITEMFIEYQALEAERNGYCKELEKYTKSLERPKCPICHRFLGKNGVCSNEKCRETLIISDTHLSLHLPNTPSKVVYPGDFTFKPEKADSCKFADQFRDATKKVEDDDKPLLADAKVGDLCKRRDGKWVDIDRNDCMVSLKKENYEKLHRACSYLNNGSTIYVGFDGKCLGDHPDFDIISTESLAPEGSKEWAWQQMLLGNVVRYPSHEYPDNQYMLNGNTVVCLNGYHVNKTIKWDNHMDGMVGWQIYNPDHIVDTNKMVEADENIDLTDAPFEGLEGVKVDDPILFSDGVVREVVLLDQTNLLPSAIKVNPYIIVNSNGCAYFNISDGKHWENNTPIRAIRIATPIDRKLYGGSK